MRSTLLGLTIPALVALFAAGCGDGGTGTGGSGGTGGSHHHTGGSETGGGGSGGSSHTGGSHTGGSHTGGSSTGGSGTGGSSMAIKINFEGRVGAETFDCADTYADLGSNGAEAKITDFRLYVHDVALIDQDGNAVPVTLDQDGIWQYQNLALLDFESGSGSCANGTAELHPEISGIVPMGTYNGISFKVGVPFELNHQDVAVAPSPLNLSALFWNWNGGYKFVRVDSLATGAAMAFNLHLGSTGCLDDGNGGVSSCSNPNRPEVSLTGFDPLTTTILVDYASVIADNDIAVNGGGAPGCMSGTTDPECGPLFDRLGLALDTGMPKAGQSFFRVE